MDGLAFSGLINNRPSAEPTPALSPEQLASMSVDQLRRALTELAAR